MCIWIEIWTFLERSTFPVNWWVYETLALLSWMKRGLGFALDYFFDIHLIMDLEVVSQLVRLEGASIVVSLQGTHIAWVRDSIGGSKSLGYPLRTDSRMSRHWAVGWCVLSSHSNSKWTRFWIIVSCEFGGYQAVGGTLKLLMLTQFRSELGQILSDSLRSWL